MCYLILDYHFCFLHFLNGNYLVSISEPTDPDFSKSTSSYYFQRNEIFNSNSRPPINSINFWENTSPLRFAFPYELFPFWLILILLEKDSFYPFAFVVYPMLQLFRKIITFFFLFLFILFPLIFLFYVGLSYLCSFPSLSCQFWFWLSSILTTVLSCWITCED